MAGAARIGALHVMLGLDSAQFTAGLNKASNGLDKFARGAKVGLGLVAAAAVSAGTALAFAVKGAIDNADELSKTAQKVGVTTEALSRLNWAASLSDVSLGQLSTGLGRLTAGMSQIAQGAGGQAKMAFDALGISALDANGKLRSSDEVFADIAERFGRMEDGATKTALAIALFGRSGAELIPLLNSGKAGLADMAAEADRLGITISGTTGRAAEQFNDTITRLQATFQGVINTIMAGAVPSLNQLANKLADPSFAAAAQALAQGVVGALNAIVDAVNASISALGQLANLLDWMSSHDWSTGEIDPAKAEARRRGAMAEIAGQLGRGEAEAPGADFYAGIFGAPAAEVAATNQAVATSFEPVIANTQAAAAGANALKQAMTEGKAVFEATRTPAETYGLEVERLNALLQKGAIDQDTYNRAVKQAQDAFQEAESSGNQWVSSLADDLSGLFGSILDGSKSATEAVGDLIRSFGQMALQQGFQMLLGGLFGGGGFKIPGFANGTNYAPGGLAMVGERGPELVNLPRGSRVIPNEDLRGGGMNVRVSLDNAMLKAVVTDEAGRVVGQAAPAIVAASVQQAGKGVPGALARYQNDQAGSDYRL